MSSTTLSRKGVSLISTAKLIISGLCICLCTPYVCLIYTLYVHVQLASMDRSVKVTAVPKPHLSGNIAAEEDSPISHFFKVTIMLLLL